MSKAIDKVEPESDATAIERVLIAGDLAKLSPEQRVIYYNNVCKSLGINPLTKPFAYIKLNGNNSPLTLYALKGCTDQLRAVNGISVTIINREIVGDIYTVTARATCNGRTDEDEGSLCIKGKRGEDLANAYMKALTKAKRRVTLSLVGLGMLDETEVETIPGAVVEQAPYARLEQGHPEGKGDLPEPRESAGEEAMRRTYNKWVSEIGRCDNAAQVREDLDTARADLDTTEFQELQLVADEHLAFLGEA